MKAIVVREYGEPEVLKLEDVPRPEPGPGQVLVRVRAAGVNPADTYARSGKYANKPPLPYTPGTDGAGTVEAAGPGVESLKPGDRVYLARSVSGTYAEYALALEAQAHRLPEAVSFAQGAALFVPYAAAYRALFQLGRARAGDTVLVHGATGGVGVAALQFAKAAGLTVIGTAGSDRGRELALREGASHVVGHGAPGCRDEIHRLTGGRGVDLIVEMLANENLGADLGMLAKGGRVVVVGSRGEATINPRDIMSRDAAVLGMLLWNISPSDEAEAHAAIADGLERGSLRPVVGETLPLERASEAHRKVLEAGSYGKIVLEA
jgi:NADPH:quinone reductase